MNRLTAVPVSSAPLSAVILTASLRRMIPPIVPKVYSSTYTETARVRPPGDSEAQFLRMDPDQRVVTIQRTARTARTAAGRIVEVNQITLPAHQWELVYEWAAE